ncbi:MAG: hypothetical protein K1Y02_13990 [Candidatus Hydrogenedentes bacterium]|nr:hypothetical protein [Candidatus Hydrogenedentota bacterium]
MKRIDVRDRKEQRKFGVTMAVAFSVLAGIRWWLTSNIPFVFLGLASVFLLTGLIIPRVLGPVFSVWMRFAEAINWVMTRVLLTVAYYAVLTPARYLNDWFGSDPLKRTWHDSSATYWEDPDEQPADSARYRNQF